MTFVNKRYLLCRSCDTVHTASHLISFQRTMRFHFHHIAYMYVLYK